MVRKIKPEDGWAIVGDYGLYVGWQQTRTQAIAEHVGVLFGFTERNGQLTDEQKRAWAACQAKGDRAVKVRISQRR